MHSAITSRDSLGGFGSTQVDYGLRARFLAAGFDIGADTRLTNVAQSVADSIVSIEDGRSERVVNQLRVDHVGARGVIGVGGSIETASFGASSTPPQSSWGAHLERFQFWPRFPRWTVSAAAQRLSYGDVSTMTSRAELNVEIPNSLRIALGAERGTARDQFGALHTMITLKVERASTVSVFDRRQETGVVYQDRNANGIRDPGEPGVAGIVVHRGSGDRGHRRQRRVPDDKRVVGARRCRRPIASKRMGTESTPSRPGNRPSRARRHSDHRARRADRRRAAAPTGRCLRCASEWRHSRCATRPGATGSRAPTRREHASFDALPAGRYTLTTELEGSSEPLLIDPMPTIEIGGTPGRQRVVVIVRTRPIRIFKTKQQTEKRGNERSEP